MEHQRPAIDIGYSDTIAAVMTLWFAAHRAITPSHRFVPPPEGSLAARGYTPLPKFPGAVTQMAQAPAMGQPVSSAHY